MGSGTSQRCFQKSGICWVGHRDIAFDRLTCVGLQGGLSGADTRGLTCQIVFVGGWLGEDLMELCSSCRDVGYVRDGFPDEVG